MTCRRSSIIIEVHVTERLPVRIADDEAFGKLIDRTGWREAARRDWLFSRLQSYFRNRLTLRQYRVGKAEPLNALGNLLDLLA